jgi:hypothetical protein
MQSNSKIQKYIKDKSGEKVEMDTTSVNLKKTQIKFFHDNNLNLSQFVRDQIDELMASKSLLSDAEILALLGEYDRLDVNPSPEDENRMQEIMSKLTPQDVLKVRRKLFSTKENK